MDYKEKYIEYEFLMQQLQQLQQNISALDKHIVDLNSLDQGLEQLTKIKTNQETLIPFGSGIFLKGEIKDNSTVIMNVGNNICVEKTLDEARETVAKQLEEVTLVLEQLREEMERNSVQLNSLQQEFESLRKEELE